MIVRCCSGPPDAPSGRDPYMEKIKVTCDSTCDLTPELYEQYGVQVLPLGITLGEELHYDSVDVTAGHSRKQD